MVDVPLPRPRPITVPLPRPRFVPKQAAQTAPPDPQTRRLVSMARTAEAERSQQVAPVNVPGPGNGFEPSTQVLWNEQELRYLPSLYSPPGAGTSLDWLNAQEGARQEDMNAMLYPPDPREVQELRRAIPDVTADPMRAEGDFRGESVPPGPRPQSFVELMNQWRVGIRDLITWSVRPEGEAAPAAPAETPPGETVNVEGFGNITLPAAPAGEPSVQDVLEESRRLLEEARQRRNQNPRSGGRGRRR